ncbi:MAG: hypothetical protein Q9195_003329 [Heterodermia aff. obscurata]
MADADNEPSYIDYETFLDPSFSPASFANSLVLATNNPSDTPVDLSTPLSRVLFDIQEIDTHIHTLTTKNAIPLLTHTKEQTEAGELIVKDVKAQVASLTDGYQRLEKEVIDRYEAANEVRQTVERLWETVRIGRSVSRCLLLCRQLEAQMSEINSSGSKQKEAHSAMPAAAHTIHTIRQLFDAETPLLSITLLASLQTTLITPSDTTLRARAQATIREFSMSSLATTSTYAQSEDTKARTVSACLTLQTLSPQLLLAALQSYLRNQLTSSLASLARALGNLNTLDRTLVEVSARCQNIVALEALLAPISLLVALLSALDTPSLPSYFWRSLAEGLAPRVQELVSRGGAQARALRAQRERVREGVRGCVLRGSQGLKGEWEREAAVMVGSVVGVLGR